MSEELTQRILKVIADSQKLPPEKVTIDSTFEELAMDSLDAMNLLFALEEQLGVSIPDDDANSIKDVRGTVAGVQKLLAEQSRSRN